MKHKLKEHLLRNITLPINSSQNTQRKYGNVAKMKSTSTNNKSKPITPKVVDKETPPNTSTVYPSLDYNIVDEMKKAHVNISLFELIEIASQQELLVCALEHYTSGNDAYSQKGSGMSSGSLQSLLNVLTLDVSTLCPPFTLMLKIFNYNVHNCLVDSGASVNVMPLFVENKINAKWDKTDAQII